MLNAVYYLNFQKGTIETSGDNIKLDYKKSDITHITILDPTKIKLNTDKRTTLESILKTSLIEVNLVIDGVIPLSYTYYPRKLEDINNNNVLQVVTTVKNKIHISFKDFAFTVQDIHNKPLILIKNKAQYNNHKKQLKKYPTKTLTERTKQYV